MGLLSIGTPLPWAESKQYNDHVRHNGVQQLLHILKAAYRRDSDPLLWGDEIEYMMLQVDEYAKDAVLTVEHDKVLKELNTNYKEECQELNIKFHPEYGRYMVESTPLQPYEGFALTEVEHNMSARRHLLLMLLEKNGVVCLSSTVFPRMGAEGFTNLKDPWGHKNSVSRSLYLPDEIINRHARFSTLTANIRTRRGEKVCMNIPMYIDDNTPAVDDTVYHRDWFLREDTESVAASRPGHIYLDAMGFGMGCSCLQVTFSAPNVGAARYLYDSLANFAPIMLSLSAAAPFLKGWLSDWDVRWNIISGAVDDRTPYERSTHPTLQYAANHTQGSNSEEGDMTSKMRIPKSRYSAVDLYLGGNKFFRRALNDVPVPVNEKVLDMMQNNELFKTDEDLARHFAHLFIRDPLVIFSELLDQDNKNEIDHFENIQSTNWQTLRFKPPSQYATPENKAAPGWRVEFRPMEAQLTDFENAAYANFIYLIVECLILFRDEINTYIPMSAVWENMELAHSRDSVLHTKFYWKKEFSTVDNYEMDIYSIDEVFHNNENGIFPQFIDRILRHKGYIKKHWTELADTSDDNQETKRLYYYLKLISDRAKGLLPTTARYLRDLVLHHPEYKHDSKITKRINFDIVMTSLHLTNLDGCEEIFEFFGPEIGKYLLEHRL